MAVHGPADPTFPVKPPLFFHDLPLSEPSRWAISATAPPRHQRRDLLGALAAGISLLIPKMQVPEPCTRARNNLGAADRRGPTGGRERGVDGLTPVMLHAQLFLLFLLYFPVSVSQQTRERRNCKCGTAHNSYYCG